ncbi:DUF1905 domain-containing protein [Streptomyces yaizuensis]|uniref:DUF1905 domain-containing protein n=1 Tax=Streptomyces yaizuensis TaxID=2989713 RepID=A0ABQ5P939_9ACTN|nr:DUF1905 domain-containing protein [Streptomyces sp. YSPA8]GLF98766.1 DUF1905 domain-containing protein [Streptomyces sp. YSPA8]
MAAAATPQDIDTTFSAEIIKENTSGWICVIMPGSGDFFGTRKAVKVSGVADGHEFQATMLPMGDGTHMLPLRAALRKTLGKDAGDNVTVHLQKRLS